MSGDQIFKKIHTCGSYNSATTKIWATGNYAAYGHAIATGLIADFHFLWL